MKITKILSGVLLGSVIFSGCATKVSTTTIVPAEIERATKIKRIAVTDFKKDRLGLSQKVETALVSTTIKGQKYFVVANRSDLDKVMKESKLQSEDSFDTKTAVKIGNLLGVQAIVTGVISKTYSEDQRFYEGRSRCGDKKCTYTVEYKVSCVKRTVGMSGNIKLIDIEKGDIIHTEGLDNTSVSKHCSDQSGGLPSKDASLNKMANVAAKTFVYKLSPHEVNYQIVLLEDPDIDYTDDEEQTLKNFIEVMKAGRTDKGERFAKKLVDLTKGQSYVALYNLGVIQELKSETKSALKSFIAADSLVVTDVPEISKALNRIKLITKNTEKFKKDSQIRAKVK